MRQPPKAGPSVVSWIAISARRPLAASALAQRDVIGSPIRHSVPLLRDVMAAILVRFERHGGCPGSGTGP